MEKTKKRIKDALKAWKEAKSSIRKKAKKLYEEIEEVLQKDPKLAGDTSVVLFKISQLALEHRYVEAIGYLSFLSICLYYEYKRSNKSS